MNEKSNLIESAKAVALALEITVEAAGEAAFRTGKARVPALDLPAELASPRNLKAWLRGWDKANVAAPVPAWTAEENAAYVAAVVRPAPEAGVPLCAALGQPCVSSVRVDAAELSAFAQAVQNNIVAEDRVSYPNLAPVNIRVVLGKKFAKLVSARNPGNDDSVYCFVELSTGNILKAASWRLPAKHARGNIRHGDQSNWWNGALNSTGAAYLR